MTKHKYNIPLITYDRIRAGEERHLNLVCEGAAIQKGDRFDFYTNEQDEQGRRVGGLMTRITGVNSLYMQPNCVSISFVVMSEQEAMAHSFSSGGGVHVPSWMAYGYQNEEDYRRDQQLEDLIKRVEVSRKPSVKDKANVEAWKEERDQIQARRKNVNKV